MGWSIPTRSPRSGPGKKVSDVPVSAHDVAAYILRARGPMTAMKLQKLAYYAHAWHLVWEETPLFPERIEAWANGPVVRELYRAHKGQFSVSEWPHGNPDALAEAERSTLDAVLDFYGEKTAHELSELSHSEDPWRLARSGLDPGAWSVAQITDASMFEYYDSLTSQVAG
jgi:uncharacterized phage-associated protein